MMLTDWIRIAVAVSAAVGLVACGSVGGGGHAHHVVDGSGKPLGDAYKECVNTGHSVGEGHGADCAGAVAAAAAPEPAPVIKAPEPAAQPAPAPPAPKQTAAEAPVVVEKGEVVHAPLEQLTLQADALFQFGRADAGSLLPAAKARLDEFAARVAKMDHAAISAIDVTGHADRLGGAAANQQLSRQRAETIKNYLVAKGLPARLMRVSGKGETAPVVDCQGDKPNPKLKACLAANRRAEVVVYGQK